MLKIRTAYTVNNQIVDKETGEVRPEFPRKYQRFTQKSMTVPDQALSIKEIMDKFTRGVPLPPGLEPVFHDDEYLPDLKTMDYAEIEEYTRNVRQEKEKLEGQLKEAKKVKAAKAKEAKEAAEKEAAKEGKKPENPPA